LKSGGPALLFEKPKGHRIPVLGNLFGAPSRIALAMGAGEGDDPLPYLRQIGHLLASLKEPEPPQGVRDAFGKLSTLKRALWARARTAVASAPCREVVWQGGEVDLARLPIQTCWPGDAGPLLTWGLVVTRGPNKKRQNLGIYRQQVIGRNRLIMR